MKTFWKILLGIFVAAIVVIGVSVFISDDEDEMLSDTEITETEEESEEVEVTKEEPQEEPKEEPQEESEAKSEPVITFTTTDLDGNEVDESILSEKEYTMVNLWGTFCGPCIGEMPELAEIAGNMPDNMQLIGIICDVYDGEDTNVDTAKSILSDTGAEVYTNLKFSEDLYNIFSEYNFIPTTVFFDSEGNMMEEPIVGADVDAYKEIIAKYGK